MAALLLLVVFVRHNQGPSKSSKAGASSTDTPFFTIATLKDEDVAPKGGNKDKGGHKAS